MGTEVHTIRLGLDHVYLLKDQGVVLIDGGAPKQAKNFIKGLEEIRMSPNEVKLIVLTHGHWDHIGSVKEIKELTGAKIAMHKNEKEWLEKSLKPTPPGVSLWGKMWSGIIAYTMVPFLKVPPGQVDWELTDEEYSLTDFGIQGRIIPTPGHSKGSVSVLLDSGDAFVGDLAMNNPPLRFSPGLPILADDMNQVKKSWEKLLDMGAKTVHPAHGNPFSVDIIREELKKV